MALTFVTRYYTVTLIQEAGNTKNNFLFPVSARKVQQWKIIHLFFLCPLIYYVYGNPFFFFFKKCVQLSTAFKALHQNLWTKPSYKCLHILLLLYKYYKWSFNSSHCYGFVKTLACSHKAIEITIVTEPKNLSHTGKRKVSHWVKGWTITIHWLFLYRALWHVVLTELTLSNND